MKEYLAGADYITKGHDNGQTNRVDSGLRKRGAGLDQDTNGGLDGDIGEERGEE